MFGENMGKNLWLTFLTHPVYCAQHRAGKKETTFSTEQLLSTNLHHCKTKTTACG